MNMMLWFILGAIVVGLLFIWFAPNNINGIRVLREYVRTGATYVWDKILDGYDWIKRKLGR